MLAKLLMLRNINMHHFIYTVEQHAHTDKSCAGFVGLEATGEYP
jgi:hypothetical protein